MVGRPHVDLAIAAVVFAAQVFGTTAVATFGAEHQHTRLDFSIGAAALLAIGPISLVLRRRYPRAVLVVAYLATLAYWVADFPKGPIFFALIVAFVTVVLAGYHAMAVATVVTGWAAFSWLPYLVDRGDRPTWGGVLGLAAWHLVLLSGAEIARSRHANARVRVLERATKPQRRRASDERLRIAQDLHDVLAHNISLINVQAGVALHLGDELPEPARAAFTAIKAASKEALGELRSVLDILRDPDNDLQRGPVPGLADLDSLVAHVNAAGLTVRNEVTGTPRPLTTGVDVAAYRIVQEALTNVARHAGVAHASVRVEYADDGVTVEVA